MGEYGRKNRGVEENRFYSPPAMRRQQQKAAQHQQNNGQLNFKHGGQGNRPVGSAMILEDGGAGAAVSSSGNMLKESIPEVDDLTNLDRFIEHTTPRVPAQILSKTSMRERKKYDGEFHPYFVLGDLWDSFKEWSAYGAGVPLVLNGNESVVQYYVPYLSGIQLYIDPSKPPAVQRPGEESDDSSRESSSDGMEEFGVDGGNGNNILGTLRLQNHSGNSTLAEGLSRFLRNYPFTDFPSDEIEIRNPPGLLIFEYFAQDPPYGRKPLAEQISQLASGFPELRTYKSCDLTTASWISVAWYPIYRIPVGPTLQNLDAGFLTYHSLSTSLTRAEKKDLPHLHGSTSKVMIENVSMPLKLALPCFGLAAYKFRISFWNLCGNLESQKVNSLNQAAEKWLRQLQVTHPDFRFFQSHSAYS